MTVVAVLAHPPREGHVLTELAKSSPLSTAEAADLYEALLRDTLLAVDRSGGELLINYPESDQIEGVNVDEDTDATLAPEAELRTIAADTLNSLDDVRFEPQVGSTFDARAGNTVTHLLREEGARSVAIVEPTAPFLTRQVIDAAAMKLRTAETVLGPATRGRCHFAGFTEPIDFSGAYTTPAIMTLSEHARDVGNSVDFLETQPVLETGPDLFDVVPQLRARFAAERVVPEHLASFVHETGLDVVADTEQDEDGYGDGESKLVRG